MESRIQRYHRVKQEKKLRRQRSLILVFCIIVFFGGLNMVDDSYKKTMIIDNTDIINFQHYDDTYKLHLFGNDYLMRQEDIDNKIRSLQLKLNEGLETIKYYGNNIIDKIKKVKSGH